MKHKSLRLVSYLGLSLWGLMLFSACAQKEIAESPLDMRPDASYWQRLITEAQAESNQLRAQLANDRIMLAKQRAEVQRARKEMSSLRDREAGWTKKIADTHSEVSTLQTERDQLRRQNAELKGKTAGLPSLLELIQEMRTVQSSIMGVASTIQGLSMEVATLKQDVKTYQAKLNSTLSSPKAFASSSTLANRAPLPNEESITVKRGDSLWAISQDHGTTIEALQELNNITGHLIYPGQKLIVRKISSPKSEASSTETVSSQPLESLKEIP
jgi:LysM repeat protein